MDSYEALETLLSDTVHLLSKIAEDPQLLAATRAGMAGNLVEIFLILSTICLWLPEAQNVDTVAVVI